MPTETLHFQYDPMELAKQLLIIYFESKLKAFDTSLLSHGNYEIKYETPVFIREAVYEALENMSDHQLQNFMGKVAKFYDITDEFKFDLYLPEIFERIVESDYFLEILEKCYQKHPVFDSYVKDLTNNNIYKANYSCHYEVVVAILSQHPELDTPEKQDDFVMNQLKLVGESYNQTWYKPKYFIRHKDDDTKLYQYDYKAAFEKVYHDARSAYKTEKPLPLDFKSEYILNILLTYFEQPFEFNEIKETEHKTLHRLAPSELRVEAFISQAKPFLEKEQANATYNSAAALTRIGQDPRLFSDIEDAITSAELFGICPDCDAVMHEEGCIVCQNYES